MSEKSGYIPSKENIARAAEMIDDTGRELHLEELLSGQDREVVGGALRKLKEHLESLPMQRAPNIFLFPEVSARPLVAAVKPIVEHVYARSGIDQPLYRFINIYARSSDGEMYPGIYVGDTEKGVREHLEFRIENMQEEAEKGEEWAREELAVLRAQREGFDAAITRTQQSMQHLIDRLLAILSERKDASERQSRICVVDDFTNVEDTYMIFSRAMKEVQKSIGHPVPWEWFTFYYLTAGRDTATWPQGMKPGQTNMIIGAESRDSDALYNYRGFAYRKLQDHNEERVQEHMRKKEGAIGVRKDLLHPKKYVDVSEKRDVQSMRLLRNALRKIAKEIVKEKE